MTRSLALACLTVTAQCAAAFMQPLLLSVTGLPLRSAHCHVNPGVPRLAMAAQSGGEDGAAVLSRRSVGTLAAGECLLLEVDGRASLLRVALQLDPLQTEFRRITSWPRI